MACRDRPDGRQLATHGRRAALPLDTRALVNSQINRISPNGGSCARRASLTTSSAAFGIAPRLGRHLNRRRIRGLLDCPQRLLALFATRTNGGAFMFDVGLPVNINDAAIGGLIRGIASQLMPLAAHPLHDRHDRDNHQQDAADQNHCHMETQEMTINHLTNGVAIYRKQFTIDTYKAPPSLATTNQPQTRVPRRQPRMPRVWNPVIPPAREGSRATQRRISKTNHYNRRSAFSLTFHCGKEISSRAKFREKSEKNLK